MTATGMLSRHHISNKYMIYCSGESQGFFMQKNSRQEPGKFLFKGNNEADHTILVASFDAALESRNDSLGHG